MQSVLVSKFGLSRRQISKLSNFKWHSVRPRMHSSENGQRPPRVYYSEDITLRDQTPITDENTAFNNGDKKLCAQVTAMNEMYMLELTGEAHVRDLQSQVAQLSVQCHHARIEGIVAVLSNRYPVSKNLLVQLMLGMYKHEEDVDLLNDTYVLGNCDLLEWSEQAQVNLVVPLPPVALRLSEEGQARFETFAHIAVRHVCLHSIFASPLTPSDDEIAVSTHVVDDAKQQSQNSICLPCVMSTPDLTEEHDWEDLSPL